MLIKTVESIQAGTYKNVHPIIVADGNQHIFDVANKRLHNVSVLKNDKRMDWVFSVNRVLKEFDSDYYIYGSDDLTFPPKLIEYAMATMKKRFHDGFGVVSIGKKHRAAFGLFGRKFADHFPDRQVFCPDCITCAMARMQECFPDGFGVVSIGKKNKCTFGLFGRKWADHFPDRQVFCPDFIHYAGDSELMRTVAKLGKFTFPPERDEMVRHARMKDEAWRLARRVRTRDHTIRTKREEKGYMWGIDFNLVVERR